MKHYISMLLVSSVFLLGCGSDSVRPTTPKGPTLDLVIGDIEGVGASIGCPTLTTLATANSINVGSGVNGSATLTFSALIDTTGAATAIEFVFDVGGVGAPNIFCNLPGDALESNGISGNGSGFLKPWHIAGLAPGQSYAMTFTGGGRGAPGASIRIFVDVDGNGTLETSEVEDLIGLDGVVETRTFSQTITADTAGVVIGEYWGGSTNGVGQSSAWRGWTIVSAP